jgi:diguanylate cyclase (GGDEF)-like protein/PAS domain S-box-containing protein
LQSRNSIARKVTLGIGAIVFGAIVAMFTTYFVSTSATNTIQESQEHSQAMLSATAGMEVSTISGGLQLFKYLETSDSHYRWAYQRNSDQFQQHYNRFRTLAHLKEWQDAGHAIADYQKQLDQIGLDLMSRHDMRQAEVLSAYTHMQQLEVLTSPQSSGSGAPGSTRRTLTEKVKAGLADISLWLGDFLHNGKNGQQISEKIDLMRSTIVTHAPDTDKRYLAELQKSFTAYSESIDQLLQSTSATRTSMTKTLELQQAITSTIATRIRPSLTRYTEDTRNRMDSQMIRVLLVAGGMSLLLSLLAVLAGRFLRRSIVTPIQKLASGTDAVAAGNLAHRVEIDTNDEYSDLAKNFNHMVDQLQGTTVSKSLHEEQETQLRTLLDGVHDYAIFSIDDQGFVTKWNQASTRILGYETEDMQGVSFARIFKDTQNARITRDEGLLAIASNGHFESDTTLIRKDGASFEANMVVTPFSTGDSGIKGYSVVVRDITERVKAERHIEQLATKDALTGLSNRSMLMDQMNTAIARALRSQTQLVVMFIDLDHFKAVNDTLGHAAGDELLRECAKRLTECVREMDIVARLGGDEFVVLLTDVTDMGIVSPIADRMLKLLTTPYRLHGHDAQTSASIGICFYPTDGKDVTALMKNADIAMYHAKELHRNNYQFYAEEMNQRMLRRLQLERDLRNAVQNNEFVLYYQPQVIVATGEIRGAESLLRWQHPTEGLLSPTGFISVAEDTGLILPMGEWILNEACRNIKIWRSKGVGIPYVVVNVSAAQLSEGLVTSVRQALIHHDIEPGWLMLEITETMLMEHVEEAISILRRIRELGIRIAMDDFGTGYSSLSVLQRLPLDTLKIDRSFVSAIDDDVNNARAIAIIGAIIAIAKELNLSVVAEGVESTTQLAFLRTLNCDTYQGYLYSKPIDAATLELRFAAPVKSVLEDDEGRAITMTTKVTMDIASDA